MISTILRHTPVIGRLRYLLLERYYSQTTRIILIGLCILMTMVSTVLLRNADGLPKLILGFAPALVIVGLAGFLLLYFNMTVLPAVMLLLTLMVHEGIGTGTGTKLTFGFLLLNVWVVLWLFKMFVVERKVEIRSTPSNLLVLLFMMAVVISHFWSYAFVEYNVRFVFDGKVFARLMTSIVLIISPATYLLFANHVRSMKMIRFFGWTFVAFGGFMMLMHFGGLGNAIPIFNNLGQFPTWVGGIALGQALFNNHLHRILRIALLGIVAGWVFIQFIESIAWLSGWLPLLMVCGIIVFFYSRRLFVVLLIAGGLFYFAQQVFFTDTLEEENTVSGETRVGAWNQVFALTGKHYLFGTGPAGYEYYFSTYQGYMYQLSHNNYIDIIAQTGLFGFSLYIMFWLSTTYMAAKLFFTMPRKNDFAHGFGLSLIAFNPAIYVIMMLGDWVTPFTYTQGLSGIDYTIWPWMMTGLTVALYYENQKIRAQEAASENALLTVSSESPIVPQIAASQH